MLILAKKTMKHIILFFAAALILSACNSSDTGTATKSTKKKAQDSYSEMQWIKMGDLESNMKEEPRKVLIDVYTNWCGPCKMMDRSTFKDSTVINKLAKNFYSVKFNAEGPDAFNFNGKTYDNKRFDPKRVRSRNGQHSFTPTLSVRGYPTQVIMDENFKIIDRIVGYKNAAQLSAALDKHINSSK